MSPSTGPRTLTGAEHTEMLRCRDHILRALRDEQEHRLTAPDWVERERSAVTMAAREWAAANGLDVRPTLADVRRIERLALGHVDYSPKLALYVAEFVFGGPR